MNAPLVSGTIQVDADLQLRVLDDLSRFRELDDQESELLEQLLRVKETTSRKTHNWTTQDHLELIDAASRHGGIKEFAASRGLSKWACHMKLSRLRKTLNGIEGALAASKAKS